MTFNTSADVKRLMQRSFPASTAVIATIRKDLRALLAGLACSEKYIESTVLAVDEAICNVVQHAYSGEVSGDVILAVERHDRTLLFRVTDFAEPVDNSAIQSRDLDDIRPGGLGVFLMRKIMDKVEYCAPANGGGNVLEMSRQLEESPSNLL